MTMSMDEDWEPLTLGKLRGANEGFEDAMRRARDVFELQDQGIVREGPFVVNLELRFTWKGGGAVEVVQRTKWKEPARKDDVVFGQDTRTGIKVHKGQQDDLPFTTDVVSVKAKGRQEKH
jgi:hypothetical protein